MSGAKTQEELIEQIEEDAFAVRIKNIRQQEDAFAEHILVESLEEIANEILDEMKDQARARKLERTSP